MVGRDRWEGQRDGRGRERDREKSVERKSADSGTEYPYQCISIPKIITASNLFFIINTFTRIKHRENSMGIKAIINFGV